MQEGTGNALPQTFFLRIRRFPPWAKVLMLTQALILRITVILVPRRSMCSVSRRASDRSITFRTQTARIQRISFAGCYAGSLGSIREAHFSKPTNRMPNEPMPPA